MFYWEKSRGKSYRRWTPEYHKCQSQHPPYPNSLTYFSRQLTHRCSSCTSSTLEPSHVWCIAQCTYIQCIEDTVLFTAVTTSGSTSSPTHSHPAWLHASRPRLSLLYSHGITHTHSLQYVQSWLNHVQSWLNHVQSWLNHVQSWLNHVQYLG